MESGCEGGDVKSQPCPHCGKLLSPRRDAKIRTAIRQAKYDLIRELRKTNSISKTAQILRVSTAMVQRACKRPASRKGGEL